MMPSTITLANGRRLHIRPLTPADAPALLDLFDHLGPDSRYRRFHISVGNPTSSQIEAALKQLTTITPGRDAAFLVLTDTSDAPQGPVAVFRYNHVDDEAAEIAFVVRDDMQGQGIGRALIPPLVEHARHAGIRHLQANVQADNKLALRLLRRLPYARTNQSEGATTVITFNLDQPLP